MCVTSACRVVVLFLVLQTYSRSIKELKPLKRDCNFTSGIKHVHRRKWPALPALYVPHYEGRPLKSVDFDPSYGYDPYWPEGDWVYQKLQTTTEKQNGTLCGNVCPELYRVYGPVCGRDINYTHKTFEDYCELVNEDCLDRAKWLLVYRGQCKELKTYPPHSNRSVSRAMEYLAEFDKRTEMPIKSSTLH